MKTIQWYSKSFVRFPNESKDLLESLTEFLTKHEIEDFKVVESTPYKISIVCLAK